MTDAKDILYPDIEPFESGMLAVGDGHEIYYEVCGNPAGLPAMFLHGGPGGGCSKDSRRFFDPALYKIVVFDQRGCGRSKPNASVDWQASLKCNTTAHLVEDCEKLRAHTKVDVWHVVLGGSWGSTLALAYSEAHPEHVSNIVLRGVFLFDNAEVEQLFQNGGSAMHHPEAWDEFVEHIRATSASPEAFAIERQNLVGAYFKRLSAGDKAVQLAAAEAFVRYELKISKTFVDDALIDSVVARPETLVPFALFEAVYMLENGFMPRGKLIGEVARIAAKPIAIVHGRSDFVCRPEAAWRLVKALKAANPKVDVDVNFVAGAGHSDSEPGIRKGLIAATDRFAARKA